MILKSAEQRNDRCVNDERISTQQSQLRTDIETLEQVDRIVVVRERDTCGIDSKIQHNEDHGCSHERQTNDLLLCMAAYRPAHLT